MEQTKAKASEAAADAMGILKAAIKDEVMAIQSFVDRVRALEEIQDAILDVHPLRDMPVTRVRWVPMENVQSNAYNPNSVAQNEMRLLYTSIRADGYTQPVVVVENDDNPGHYTVVDGYHRYTIMATNADIRERTGGLLPVVVLEIPMNERMASTVRHNRARGKHAVEGMGEMVFEMLDGGWSDAQICNELGMEPDELYRLKYLTGFSKLFENHEYRKAWESRKQIKNKKDYERRLKMLIEDGHDPGLDIMREAYRLEYYDRLHFQKVREEGIERGESEEEWLARYKQERFERQTMEAGRELPDEAKDAEA